MEESPKKDPKQRRIRSDQIKQTVQQYLQRRNYPPLSYKEICTDELILQNQIETAASRVNSILYTCFNSDPIGMDQVFTKFTVWLKDLQKKKLGEDLEVVIAPLFCHIYLEILRGGHTEKASSFYKQHVGVIEKSKCDEEVRELINGFGHESGDVTAIKDYFRRDRYVVRLSANSIQLLKQFLGECGHLILLQVFQNWFIFQEEEPEESREECDTEDECPVIDKPICNGHSEMERNSDLKSLLASIEGVKNEPFAISQVNLSNVKGEITCGIVSKLRGMVGYAYNNTTWLRPMKTLEQLEHVHEVGEIPLRGHSGRVYDLDFIDHYLISGSQDKTVCLFDLNTYRRIRTYKAHEYPIFSISASPSDAIFATGGYDRTVQIFSVESGENLRWCAGHSQQVTCVKFHPNSAYVASGSVDKSVRMFSVKDGEPVRLFLGSKGAVYAVCFTSSGRYLLSGGEDRKLRVWDLSSAKQVGEIKNGPECITKIAISENEETVAVGTAEGVVRTWKFSSAFENERTEPIETYSLDRRLYYLNFELEGFTCLSGEATVC